MGGKRHLAEDKISEPKDGWEKIPTLRHRVTKLMEKAKHHRRCAGRRWYNIHVNVAPTKRTERHNKE